MQQNLILQQAAARWNALKEYDQASKARDKAVETYNTASLEDKDQALEAYNQSSDDYFKAIKNYGKI